MNRQIIKYDKPGKWEVVIPFEKVGGETTWMGIIDARQAGDYELAVVASHQVPQTRGKITVRAVVGAGSFVKIKGMIKIGKQAQETDNYLELRVLTLHKSAMAVALPELEIEANNVRASHGASVGGVDGNQVLYMQSRGLTREQAIEEIVSGWLGV